MSIRLDASSQVPPNPRLRFASGLAVDPPPVRRLSHDGRCFVKRFSLSVTFWLPFVFAVLLCWLPLIFREAAAPAFYSFLPLAFMFVAFAFGRLLGELRRLEDKVRSLEAGG